MTEVSEQRALEEEALEFLLENEEGEREKSYRGLSESHRTEQGRAYHEVHFLTTVTQTPMSLPDAFVVSH